MRLTADNQVLVFHDADALRMCGSPLRIGRTAWRNLSRLRVGEHPIPTLESLLSMVDGRVPLLLEVKVERDIWRWAPALKLALEGYQGAFGVMSFDPRIPRLIKTNMPEVRRGLVIRDSLPPYRRRMAMWLADPQFVAVDRAALGKRWVERVRRRMPVYSWTIRTSEQREQARVQADALIWEADGRPRNLKSLPRSRPAYRVSTLMRGTGSARATRSSAMPFCRRSKISGSVGPGTGWTPAPIIVEEEDRLVAAAPAYLKSHSQGEYVFDHGWADAWERAGGEYYPKLQVAVPFTPVPGPRLLGNRPQQLLAAIEGVTVQNGLSSAHITFIDEPGASECERRGWLIRHGVQYHWFNRGYGSFEDFLATLTSRRRKTLRKERSAAREGLEFRALRGNDIGPAEWDAMWAFYQDTGSRKWGHPYLTREFFALIGERMGDRMLLFLAYRGSRPIAGALNFIGADTLYGRYWGTIDEVPFLHFELSYYQAVEWAIEHGLKSVQAGAQGEHKISRGYEPVVTRSAHFIPNRGFREAVADFLEAERTGVGSEIQWLRQDLPYRSTSSE